MAILKCKICGGDIELYNDQTVGVCLSCDTRITIPKISDEKIAVMFNRAEHFRQQQEFDKAISAYEHIIAEDNSIAEAHWGIVLCKYGIEYVQDTKSYEYKPTCHRASLNSVINDIDYKLALDYADSDAAVIYIAEGKRIDEINRKIIEISKKQEYYDVFICYKHMSDINQRTKDSVIAQDVYEELTNRGVKVFFASITLENMLGTEYEPCIFSALNSAKIMLAFGSRLDYFNAVWVKNEWSRFLSLMRIDKSKTIIPVYIDMDAYSIPDELKFLQAQDMNKIGAKQDLVRGVLKILNKDKPQPQQVQPQPQYNPQISEAGKADVYAELGFAEIASNNTTKAEEYFLKAFTIDFNHTGSLYGMMIVTDNDEIDKISVYYKKLIFLSETISDTEKALLNSNIAYYIIDKFILMSDYSRTEFIIKEYTENYENIEFHLWRALVILVEDGWSILAHALKNGLQLIIDKYKNTKQSNKDTNQDRDIGFNPLQLAIDYADEASDYYFIDEIIKSGADVNQTIIESSEDYSPLAYAVMKNKSIGLIKALIKNGGTTDYFIAQKSPLYLALSKNNYAISELLIENGVNLYELILLNDDDRQHIAFPLYYIIFIADFCDIKTIEFLKGNGVDLNIEIKNKSSKENIAFSRHLLDSAILLKKDIGIIKYLIDNGANVNGNFISKYTDNRLYNAPVVTLALLEKNLSYGNDITELLIDKGANVDANFKYRLPDNNGGFCEYEYNRPLIHIPLYKMQCYFRLELLLKNKANPNALFNFHDETDTPLSVAVSNPDIKNEFIEILIKYGAKTGEKVKRVYGDKIIECSLFDVLINEGTLTVDVAELLIKHGEDINKQIYHRRTEDYPSATQYRLLLVVIDIYNDPLLTKKLCFSGANPNNYSNLPGSLPVFISCVTGNQFPYKSKMTAQDRLKHAQEMLDSGKVDLTLKFRNPYKSPLFKTTYKKFIKEKYKNLIDVLKSRDLWFY